MKLGPRPLDAIEGAVLAHTHRLGEVVLKKGRVLGRADVEAFAAAGRATVIVAVLEPGDVREDEAAARVASRIVGRGARCADAATGRVNLFADAHGLLTVDASEAPSLSPTSSAERMTSR